MSESPPRTEYDSAPAPAPALPPIAAPLPESLGGGVLAAVPEEPAASLPGGGALAEEPLVPEDEPGSGAVLPPEDPDDPPEDSDDPLLRDEFEVEFEDAESVVGEDCDEVAVELDGDAVPSAFWSPFFSALS